MATSRNTKTKPTVEQVAAQTLTLVNAIAATDKAGKAGIAAATLSAFNDTADDYVALGQHLTANVAPYLAAGVTINGTNLAKLFAKDGAIGQYMDADDRAAFKSDTTLTRALTLFVYDAADARTLFVNGPDAALVAKVPALVGIAGNSASVVSYYEWTRVMNADAIAKVKAVPADTLAKFDIWRDASTGETVYAKRKAVAAGAGDAKVVKVKRDEMPALAKVAELDRDALTKLASESRYDLNIAAADMVALFEYVAARYRLSIMDAPADAPIAPAAKVTTL